MLTLALGSASHGFSQLLLTRLEPCQLRSLTRLAPCVPQAGALAAFLKDLLLTDIPKPDLIEAEFRRCIEIHFADIGTVIPELPGGHAEPPQSLLDALERK